MPRRRKRKKNVEIVRIRSRVKSIKDYVARAIKTSNDGAWLLEIVGLATAREMTVKKNDRERALEELWDEIKTWTVGTHVYAELRLAGIKKHLLQTPIRSLHFMGCVRSRKQYCCRCATIRNTATQA